MYYIVLGTGLILAFTAKRSKKVYYSYWVLLLIISVFRYGVGADYFSYAVLYDNLKTSAIQELLYGTGSQEILFRSFGSILKKIGVPYEMYVSSITIINMIFISKICTKFSRYPLMSLVLYYAFFYFVWTFSAYRQGIVLTIGVYYLLSCYRDNKTKKFIVISIVLSQIHLSAVLLIVLYFVANKSVSRKVLLTMVLLSVGVSFLPIGKIIHSLSGISIINRIKPYVSDNFSLINIFDFQSISRIVFVILGLFFYSALRKSNSMDAFIIRVYIFGLCAYFILKFSELTASRVSIYGFLLIIIIIPNVYSLYRLKFDRFLYFILVLVLSSAFLYKELNTLKNQSGIEIESYTMPYTSVFNKESYSFDNSAYNYLQNK